MPTDIKPEELGQFDDFEQIGLFWLPATPSHRCAGTIRYDRVDGISLDVMGTLQTVHPFLSLGTSNKVESILGVLRDGTELTLNICHRGSVTAGTRSSHERYVAIQMFLGANVSRLDETFSEMEIELTNFERWLATPLIDHVYHFEGERLGHTDYTMKPRERFRFALSNLNFTLEFAFPSETKTKSFNDIRLIVTPVLFVRFQAPQTIEEFGKTSYRLQNLFSLLTGKPSQLIRCRLHAGKTKVTWLNSMSQDDPKEVHPSEMFASFPLLKEQFQSCVEKWFQNYEELTPVFDLFFSSLHKPDQFVQTQFAQHVQALEVYHRRRLTSISEAHSMAVKRATQKIKAALSEEDTGLVNRIVSAVAFCKEPGLSERLSELLGLVDMELKKRFIGDETVFVRKVKDLRNYLSHYAGSKKSIPEDPNEMSLLAEQLRIILVVILLKEILVFDAKVLDAVIRRFHYVQDWRANREQDSL
jgi:hypothetical protein